MKLLVYTFKTFPVIDELKRLYGDVFVFAKLKEDLVRFEQLIQRNKPDYILGVALAKGLSRIEPLTINKFNKGQVLRGGLDSLPLYVPGKRPPGFIIAPRPTHSFCNWTMYHIQNSQPKNSLSTRFVFVHINNKDIDRLKGLIQ